MMYEDFAPLYDALIDVDYDAWTDGYERIFKEFGKKPEMVLDLACGSGEITTRLACRGYDMIGVDISPDMLYLAREKAMEEGLDILYLEQDMTSFELYGTVDATVSSLDSINYLLSEEDVSKTFHWVNNYMMDGGLIIFDINSPYKLRTILGNETYVNEEEGIFYTWENEYDEESETCSFYLNIFRENEDGTYDRLTEEQSEKVYEESTIRRLLTENSFEVVAVFGEDMKTPPTPTSERLFFVARAHNHNKEEMK